MKKRKISPIVSVLSACLFAVVVKMFGIDIMRVQGHSMEPFIESGTIILINKAAYGLQVPFSHSYFFLWSKPAYGDIVVFLNKRDNLKAIKRCIGKGGDPILVEKGYMVIGNTVVPLDAAQYETFFPYSEVPEDSIFAVGDNLDISVDSREYGFIPLKEVQGKVLFLRKSSMRGE